MRAKWSIVLIVVLLLSTVAATAASAAKPAEILINFHNRTGGVVSLRLTDAAGMNTFIELQPGVSTETMDDGVYTYYAGTICGAQSGVWNFNVSKDVYIDCEGTNLASLGIHCKKYGSWDEDFQLNLDGYFELEPDIYIGENYGFGYYCLDPYMEFFRSIPGWQIWEYDAQGHQILKYEDPHY